MNQRDEFAIRIMAGMCAGDWKLNIPDGETWDQMAVARAYELADAMIKNAKKNSKRVKNHRKMSEQMEQDVQEIVDYYMQFVTSEHHSIREGLEYFWKCMNDFTIEDYIEYIRKEKETSNV